MPRGKTKDPETFNRAELTDLIRAYEAELLVSRLKRKNLLVHGVSSSF